MSNPQRLAAFSLPCCLLSAALPAAGHHSYVMFDKSKLVQTPAIVSTWEFTSPHGKLWVYIYNNAGKPILWALEAPGPSQLQRQGWDKYTVKPGDKVQVSLNPLRNGDHGGSLVGITLADGRSMSTGGPPGGGLPGQAKK